jgi:hypothetical protein
MKQITVTPKNVRTLLSKLGQITLPALIKADELTPEQIQAVADLFDPWRPNQAVSAGDMRRYQGNLYECLQAHTTQADWTPDATPALWLARSAPGVIPEWVQPTGAHDAYDLGDIVTHNGKTWRSLIDANVWEPSTANPTLWEEVVS